MTVSKIDILNKKFTRAMRGYSQEEVDLAMHEVAEALGDLADENRRLKTRLGELEQELTRNGNHQGEFGGAISAGRKIAEEAALSAGREARQIVEEARGQAQQILAEANQLKAKVLEEVTALKALEKTFTLRMRRFLEEHFRLLESAEATESQKTPGKDFIFTEGQD